MITLAAGSALLALAIAVVQTASIVRSDAGTERMREIAGAIREGAAGSTRSSVSTASASRRRA
ncbi:MAG TPA: hypothetical protein VF469_17685 [Kofleriaceae bacterium]